MVRHRICPQCSTAVEEAAELCPGCKCALDPVLHPPALPPARALKWRLLDWGGTVVLVFVGATLLQRYYFSASVDEAAELARAARAEVSQMSLEARGAFWAASEVCGFDNAKAVARAMARLDRTAADPAAVLARCDEIGAQMRRLGLLR